MEKNELYPEGWTYRKFFAPRSVNQGTGGAKKPRADDQLVEEVLQDRQQQHQGKPVAQVAEDGPGQEAPQQA